MTHIKIEPFQAGSKVDIEGIILKTLAILGVLGIVTVAVLAPNALQLLKYIDRGKARKKNPKFLVDAALKRLEAKKLISISKSGKLRLTQKGAQKLHVIEFGVFPPPSGPWDKKWRVVSFDVNEKRKSSRDQLRLLLRQVGFVRLQNSVWVYPYDVEEVVNLIKVGNFLNKEVLYMTVSSTGNDDELKTKFKLA